MSLLFQNAFLRLILVKPPMCPERKEAQRTKSSRVTGKEAALLMLIWSRLLIRITFGKRKPRLVHSTTDKKKRRKPLGAFPQRLLWVLDPTTRPSRSYRDASIAGNTFRFVRSLPRTPPVGKIGLPDKGPGK